MLKLKDSGYSQKFKTEIIRSAKNAFNLQIQNDRKGIWPLSRNKKRIFQDQKEKGIGVTYYKDFNKQMFQLFCLFPLHLGLNWQNRCKKEAELNAHSDTRIKVVETGRHRLKHFLVQNNPYPTLLPCIKQDWVALMPC